MMPDAQVSAVHWAYLVGGSPDVFRDMRRHLIKAGINIAGHCKMEARGDGVSIPRGTTVVLCATDASNHSASDAARDEARKRGIPCVLTPFRHWSICSQRLAEAGIPVRESLFTDGQESVGVRKFQALLESATPTVLAAVAKRDLTVSTSPTSTRIRQELASEKPSLARAMGIPIPAPPDPVEVKAPEPAPAPAPAPAVQVAPAKPELPKQDITPTFNGRLEVGRPLQRKLSKKAQARQDYARKLIKDAKGEISNREVREAVVKKLGHSISQDLVNHIRFELGFKPRGRWGRETNQLSASAHHRLHLAEAGSPPQTLPPEAPKAPPAAPEPAPAKAKRTPRARGRDVLALIAEVQEELRARGIWGVMIEAGGTFTFQKEK